MQRFAMAFLTWLAFTLLLEMPTHANTITAYYENETAEEPAGKTSNAWKALANLVSSSPARPSKVTLAFSAGGRPIDVFYFPGTSDKKALVLAGVHGSELSGIEVAKLLVKRLQDSACKPYYSTWVIPCLFPDNAFAASQQLKELNSCKNIGRYTSRVLPDPNRQMPAAGTAYSELAPRDIYGRKIESENQVLLEVIQYLQPERILSIHASHDAANAGIFADPRTDCHGIALGFENDSALVIGMAKQLQSRGVRLPGNELFGIPNPRYKSDPPIVTAGQFQERKRKGSALPGNRGNGISLGTWASTAVCDDVDANNRPASMMVTLEINGCERSTDYKNTEISRRRLRELGTLAEVIEGFFVGR
jgi:hypothetical protein